MEQLQGTSPQHFEPTSQGCHILTLNSKGVPLGNSPKISIPDYQLKISTGCSLSLLQVPLVHLNPFCCTFYVPLLPLRVLKVSKGSKGTSQIHVNEHKLPQGTWNSCKAHPLNILSPPTLGYAGRFFHCPSQVPRTACLQLKLDAPISLIKVGSMIL